MINNTIISTRPEDLYLFTESSSTCDLVLINNVFAGPSTRFLERNGKGKITGTNNWFQSGMKVPATVTNSIFGDDPGFVDAAGGDFRPRPGSPLIAAGLASPQFLNLNQKLEPVVPLYEPTRNSGKPVERKPAEKLDIGAFAAR